MPQTERHIENLLKACGKGNQLAQTQIYTLYSKAMYNTAHRIVNDSFDAEDIMQEAFLTAFTKLDSLSEPAMFGPWLKKIVINRSIGRYREKKKKNEVPFEQVMYRVETDQGETETEEYTKLKVKQVLETLKSLKENYRLALTLHLIEGYDYKETSAVMEISYGSCRTMISRAKESLRKKLQQIPV